MALKMLTAYVHGWDPMEHPCGDVVGDLDRKFSGKFRVRLTEQGKAQKQAGLSFDTMDCWIAADLTFSHQVRASRPLVRSRTRPKRESHPPPGAYLSPSASTAPPSIACACPSPSLSYPWRWVHTRPRATILERTSEEPLRRIGPLRVR
jgi:hypothetical protein